MRISAFLHLVAPLLLLAANPAGGGVVSWGCNASISGMTNARARPTADYPFVTDEKNFEHSFPNLTTCTLAENDQASANVAVTGPDDETIRASAAAQANVALEADIDPGTNVLRAVRLSASFSAGGSPVLNDGSGRMLAGGVGLGLGHAQVQLSIAGTAIPYDVSVTAQAISGESAGYVNLQGIPTGGSPTIVFERGTLLDGSTSNIGSATGTLPPGVWGLLVSTKTRNGRNATSGSVSASLSLEPPAEVRWRDPVDGAFADGTRWDPQRVPAAGDSIRFDLVGPYTVDLASAARSVARMMLHTSDLTLANGTLALAGGGPALAVGLGATLALPGATLQAADAVIGDTFARRSTVRVTGGGSFTTTGQLAIGGAGPGTLEVQDGTVTADDALVGGSSGPPEVVTSGRGVARAEPDTAGGYLHVAASASGNGVVNLARAIFGGGGFGAASVDAGGIVRTSGDTVIGVSPGPGKVFLGEVGTDSDPRPVWESGGTIIVGDDAEGFLSIFDRGRVTAPDVRIGARAGSTASVLVYGTSQDLSERSELVVADTVVVGDAGAGSLEIDHHGRVTARRLELGASGGGDGTVEVRDSARVVIGEGIIVGGAGAGALDVGTSGEVSAKTLDVPASGPSDGGVTTVQGRWAKLSVQDAISVGQDAPGVLRIVDGGEVTTAHLWVGNGETSVEGTGPYGALEASRLAAEDVTVAATTGGSAELRVADGAKLEGRWLTVATGGGGAPNDPPTVLTVRDATVQAASLAIGTPGNPPFPPRPGSLVLHDGGVVTLSDHLRCEPRCTISGNGRIDLGSTSVEPAGGTLTNLGTISAGHSPGTIRVEGNLVQEASGRLVIEAGGLAPGQFDILDVTGDVTLGGTLVVRFLDGFLPKTGDVLPFLQVGGAVTGAFAAVEVEGAAQGFQFTIGRSGGAVVLTAQNDALPTSCTATGDTDGDGRADCVDNCVETRNAEQADRDGDGLGDACDPCTAGVAVTKPLLTATKGRFAFRGTLAFARVPQLEPARTGVRLVVADGAGRTLLDATAPAGAFDRRAKSGWRGLRFRSRNGALTSVALRLGKRRGAQVSFKLAGRASTLAQGVVVAPLGAILVLDAPAAASGFCGEVRFAGPAPANPVCTVSGAKLRCGGSRRK